MMASALLATHVWSKHVERLINRSWVTILGIGQMGAEN